MEHKIVRSQLRFRRRWNKSIQCMSRNLRNSRARRLMMITLRQARILLRIKLMRLFKTMLTMTNKPKTMSTMISLLRKMLMTINLPKTMSTMINTYRTTQMTTNLRRLSKLNSRKMQMTDRPWRTKSNLRLTDHKFVIILYYIIHIHYYNNTDYYTISTHIFNDSTGPIKSEFVQNKRQNEEAWCVGALAVA